MINVRPYEIEHTHPGSGVTSPVTTVASIAEVVLLLRIDLSSTRAP